MTGYCEGCDPILHAGPIICEGCDAESYPTDAEWITGTLILASYAPGCTCRGTGGVVVINTVTSDETVPAIPRPRLCRAIASTTRQQCRAVAQPGSAYCHAHNPARRPGGAR